MNQQGSITDVLSGKQSLKFEISMDYKTVAILAVSIFVAVLGAVIIARKV
jgi:hypothetical protein